MCVMGVGKSLHHYIITDAAVHYCSCGQLEAPKLGLA